MSKQAFQEMDTQEKREENQLHENVRECLLKH